MSFALVSTPADANGLILGNIFVNEVDVGGMTYDAAQEKLEREVSVADKQIAITCAEHEYTYTFRDFGADYDFVSALDAAMEYSHSGGFFDQLRKAWTLRFNEHHVTADFIYDADKITQIAQEIDKKSTILVKEPTYKVEGNQFTIKDGRNGRKVDAPALSADIIALLETKESGKIVVMPVEIHPNYTKAQFKAARDLLGSYVTPYDPNRLERTINLTVASSFLNNQVILPGETFSTSNALRSRTVENGYVAAGQILNGEPDTGIGGGICQISSTLYMAALHAEMPVRERRSHSLMVGYMAPATDAAIAEGHIDLVLENNTDYPMLIQSTLEFGRHTINIYGHESRPKGRTVAFESVLLEAMAPVGDKIIEDPLLPAGISQIVSEGIIGAKYELYKIITEDGDIRREKVNTSNYRPLPRVVKIGSIPLQ